MNNQLVEYLQAHNVAVLTDNGATLTVLSIYSMDGVAMKVWEQVPASWNAVREYLGY